MHSTLPYRSFWMGGFEGADHRNGSDTALDMAAACGHLLRLDEDYAAAAAHGICSVRESIGWRLAEPRRGGWDFDRAGRIAAAARRHGVQVLWSLMHYGTPPDVSLLDDAFIDRFAAYAAAAARFLAPLHDDEPPVYTPINEIGFLAWAVRETSLIAPYRHRDAGSDSSLRSGYDVKVRLVRGALAAMDAIRAVDPRARFLHIEPLVHVVAPPDRPELQPLAAQIAGYQWQVWDLLSGRLEPALGGSDAALDLVGINHYHSGQWEAGSERRLAWNPPDPRRRPPALLLRDAWQRYGRPLLVAETSGAGELRPAWLQHMAGEVEAARAAGTPVAGICLYPFVDRPDWDRPAHWHRSGLLDVVPPRTDTAGDGFERAPHPGYVAALVRCQRRLPRLVAEPLPALVVFSHQRWDFAWRRPQQLLSRLARSHRIVFVEEPVRDAGPARWRCSAPAPGIEVWQPLTPVADGGGFCAAQQPALRALLAGSGLDGATVWLEAPAALPLAAALRPRALVANARATDGDRGALLDAAQLVVTGSPSLFEALRGRHPNLHCLPAAVDVSYHTPARLLDASTEAVAARALLAGVEPGAPRLVFDGIVDARLDLALLAAAAAARPRWQWLLAGPVVGIATHALPRRANIHWLGAQPYAALPYLAALGDVCVLPFALTPATRHTSPAQTLEYMAAERPVVATALPDVVALYGDAVLVADSAAAFVAACERALHEPPAGRAARLAAMRGHVAARSWNDQADRVEALLRALQPARPRK